MANAFQIHSGLLTLNILLYMQVVSVLFYEYQQLTLKTQGNKRTSASTI